MMDEATLRALLSRVKYRDGVRLAGPYVAVEAITKPLNWLDFGSFSGLIPPAPETTWQVDTDRFEIPLTVVRYFAELVEHGVEALEVIAALRAELDALRAQAGEAAGLPPGWHWHGDELVDAHGTKVSMHPNGDINVSGTLFAPSTNINAAVAAFRAKMAGGAT